MSRVRHRSRAELPPSPIEFAYPLAIPDTTVLGEAILHETPDHFALHVFQALRLTFSWATGPDTCAPEFDHTDLADWEADVLRTTDVDEALWAPVAVIAGELARPADVEPDRLSNACLAVVDWALGQEAFGTAILFAEAAAVVWPNNARLAWMCGKIYRERQNHGLAAMWFRRARRVAVWTGDAELQATAQNSLGNLKVHLGDLAGGRALLLSAVRTAKRNGLRERQAKALHDLLLACIYEGRFDEAERHAVRAFALYGPDHTNILYLAFDVAVLWNYQGQFTRALKVLQALHGRFTEPHRQLRVLASTARAAGAVRDADAFYRAWNAAWMLLDSGEVEFLRAAAPLELGLGALSLSLWEHAEIALTTSRDAAVEGRESEVLARAESALDYLQRHQAADRHARPPSISGSGDLSASLVQSLNARANVVSDAGKD
ncbi:MAG TPA: tetratricopeptide repeat protein [Longimicrobium sp.]|jgi:tetratricopeptide (TPR) repeat protein|uniref:tetratricopeptide repeat protein n=1 Tax=Longimicrobium sp. TaxID=2029185 RepID=UPI002ED8C54D